MTNKKIQPLLIGIFVIFSILLIMIAIVLFGGSRFFEKDTLIITYFEGSLQGLNVGAPVTYRGVNIGQVKEISIHIKPDGKPNEKLIIPVLISLNAEETLIIDDVTSQKDGNVNRLLESMCEDGLRAKLKLSSLVTGKRYIDLAFHQNNIPVYRDTIGKHFEIPTLTSEMYQISKLTDNIDLDLLYRKAINTFDSVELLFDGLAQTFNDKKTQNLVSELSTATASLNSILSQLEKDVPRILGKVDTELTQIINLTSNADQVVNNFDNQIPPIAKSIRKTLSTIDSTVLQAKTLLTQAETTIKPSSPLYYKLSSAIKELEEMAASIKKLSDYIHRNPDTLIFGLQKTGAE